MYTPMQLAEAFIKAGELSDALEALDEHLTANPEDDNARRLRVQVLLRLNTPDALNQAQAEMQRIPHTPADDVTYSVILERLGNVEAALKSARAAYDASNDPRTLERVLDLMARTGQLEAALDIALANDWIQWAADAAANLKDHTKAAEYYTQALGRVDALFDKTSSNIAENIKARVLLKRGGCYLQLQAWAQAQADYESAAALIPDDPMIAFNLGLIHANTATDIQPAIQAMQQVIQQAPLALREIMVAELENYPHLKAQIDL